MHSNCNAPLDLSRFLVLSFPPRRRCTRARVYTLPHDSCSLLFHDKSVGLCAARITYHCLPVGKYYSNRMPRGVTIMFSFATNPIARPHRFERVGASKELQECEKRDKRDVWKFAVDDFVGRRKGLCLSRSSVWIWNEILYRTRDINDWFLLKLFIHRSLLKNDNKL